jgi:hypothetical protein
LFGFHLESDSAVLGYPSIGTRIEKVNSWRQSKLKTKNDVELPLLLTMERPLNKNQQFDEQMTCQRLE